MAEDIKQTGPVGLQGLKGLNSQPSNNDISKEVEAFINAGKLNSTQTSNLYSSQRGVQDVGMNLINKGYGESSYDEDIHYMNQLDDINEYRGQAQPWYNQLANGAIKMATTAGTTFIDGTLGTLWGVATGLNNLADDDPNTGFWRGMWDNAVTNAMASVNEEMENIFTNYKTNWEQNANVFQKMFSAQGAANFWGDSVLKNAGFTIGAAASVYATASLGGILKLGALGSRLGMVTKGLNGASELTSLGKFTNWLARTFVSINGEASIEALNAMNDNEKDTERNLRLRETQLRQSLEDEYLYAKDKAKSIQELQQIEIDYQNKLLQLENDIAAYKNEREKEISDYGNTIYAANAAVLSISNNLTLGSIIRGGFNTSKGLMSQMIKTSGGTPITSAQEAGKALLKGDLRLTAPEVKHAIPKTIGHSLLTGIQEGAIEEGSQNLASNSAQISMQASLNKWAKDNTMLGTMINPNAEEDLISYQKSLYKAWEENFGQANSPGWEEVAAGFITGILGTGSFHRNEQGKIRPTWQGGLKESWEAVTGTQKEIQKKADLLNAALTNNKFNERVKHAVQQIAIKRGQDSALERDDIQAFKNFEIQQLASDAIFFRNIGMLDDYLEMYKALGNNVTDADVNELKAMTKAENGELSALEKMSNDEIKKLYQEKALSTLSKVNKALETYDTIESKYGDKFSDGVRQEALMEMSYLETLYWDTARRHGDIANQLDELDRKENLSPLEKDNKKQLNSAYRKLTLQMEELQKTLDTYKKSPESLEAKIVQQQVRHQKFNLYKKAEEAIKKYKRANTLQEIIDVYEYSPIEERDKVLKQAIEQSEGDTKLKLQQFSNFMGDVNTVSQLIKQRFPLIENGEMNLQYLPIFNSILQDAVNEMLTDPFLNMKGVSALNKESLKEKFKKRLNKFIEDRDKFAEEAGSLKLTEDGSYDFQEAFDKGEVTEEDFESILDDITTGESHKQVKDGSKADWMIQSLNDKEGMERLINHLQYFIDSLDKLNELREAGVSKKKETKAKKPAITKDVKTEKGSFTEEIIEGEFDENEEEDSNSWEEEDEEEEEEEEQHQEEQQENNNDLLNSKEKEFYDITVVTGKSGVKYNTISKKESPAPASIKESVKKKLDKTKISLDIQTEALLKIVESAEQKQKIFNKIYDIIANNIIAKKTMEEIESILIKNSSLNKPTSASTSSKEYDSKEAQNLTDSDTSLNGNQFYGYVKSELTDKGKVVPVSQQKSGTAPLQVWLRENGYRIQHVIDTYLDKIVQQDEKKKINQKTPILYIHSKEQPNVVFLGIEYTDAIQSIIPEDATKFVTIGDKRYVLVGSAGWESAREGTKKMFESLLNEVQESHKEGEWSVIEKTNRIKDITAGSLVKQNEDDTENTVRSLSELLNSKKRNPHNLEFEDLGWIVIEGTEEKPTFKKINSEDKNSYIIKNCKPGQVYMLVPSANNMYIPVYMETLFYQELSHTSPLFKEFERLTHILADFNSTAEDKKSAIGKLRELFIFSKANQIHYNDENSKYDPNTIYITRNGEAIKLIDFNDEFSGSEEERLINAISSLNPRINISTTILSRPEEAKILYLNSGVLNTDIAHLGTVNKSFFIYPLDNDNNYVENKPHKPLEKVYDFSVKERIYLEGEYFYTDGSKFYDKKGEVIEDKEGSLKIAYDIKTNKYKPIKVNNATYYDVKGTMYVDNGHGGLSVIDSELRTKVLASQKKATKKATQKEDTKKEAERIKKEKEKEPADTVGGSPVALEYLLENGVGTIESTGYFLHGLAAAFEKITKDIETIRSKYLNSINPNPAEFKNDTSGALNEIRELVRNTYGQEGVDILTSLLENSTGFIPRLGKAFGKKLEEFNNKYNSSSSKQQSVSSKQETKTVKNNFTNGTKIDELKSQKDLENQKNNGSFASVLSKRENSDKVDALYEAVNDAFNIEADNDQELIDTLLAKKIDITSNDLDTILDIIKNCR